MEIVRRARAIMGMPPTEGQAAVINTVAAFAMARGPRDVIIIDGNAGTGKTTVVGALIKALRSAHVDTVLLAPTGRAAKVASAFADAPGSTIHKHIYRADPSDPLGNTFHLGTNYARNAVYFVDEASMVTDGHDRSLLRDLLHFVYHAQGCNIIFIGDTAQLPPVGQTDSPAMSTEALRALRLNPLRLVLDEPLRLSLQSGRLYNATVVRRALMAGSEIPPTLKTAGFDDIEVVSSADLADRLTDSYARVGREETLLITRSNWRANRYNEEIRGRVFYAEQPLQQGERLIIARNNYFWGKDAASRGFLANGETAIVEWVGRPEKMYGRWFADVELSLPGRSDVVGAKIMLRSLKAEGPAIAKTEMDMLYSYVMSQQEGELSEKMKALDSDPYLNALQVKYAYAVTCHKAQGGQWRHVYIDMGGIDPAAITPDFHRWLYTALTRATERVFLINPTLPVDL